MDEFLIQKIGTESWQSLVHVCRRWRSLVFESPRRLNLRLACTARTPARDMLDIWPPFPLVIDDITSLTEGVDNVVAALERRDRVLQIRLAPANNSALNFFLATMQEPFPELTSLQLLSHEEPVPIVPDSFLGGSAPHLRSLLLGGIHFRVYQIFFCLPLPWSFFTSRKLLIRDTFHPMWWSLPSLC